ncbi:MAG TPA: VWA domain-containing protein, partial [Nitrosopumilaceae archaeon]|nr:VWA domain-containing protein [Nitrosopumilaceae archaeon]
MQALSLRNDTLVDIATFLVRRWSGKDNITIEISNKTETRTRLHENRVIITPIDRYNGNNFQKYRQFRTSLWHEAMRVRFCKKILSSDHAFGFILNTIETRRIELLGRRIWQGMDEELIFNYSYMWSYRPLLGSVYGKARMVEAFYQYFLIGDIKGELQPSSFDKVVRAVEYAKKILDDAIEKNYDTEWLETKIPEILRMLDLDALITVPLSVPKRGPGLAVTEQDLVKALSKISKHRENDLGKVDPKSALEGKEIFDEYTVLLEENRKNENIGLGTGTIGIRIPAETSVDETKIYDLDLISNLKAKFRQWKTGWKEQHVVAGDEFDAETYIEGHHPFFT